MSNLNSNSLTVIFVVLAVFLYFTIINKQKGESFISTTLPNLSFLPSLTGSSELKSKQYYNDIRILSAYVGPYIGEIYLYLRSKYSDPVQNITLPPFYKPTSISDQTLKDPLLPIARVQIKKWIDSSKFQISQRYPVDFLKSHLYKADIYYTEMSQGLLNVTYVENGKVSNYFV